MEVRRGLIRLGLVLTVIRFVVAVGEDYQRGWDLLDSPPEWREHISMDMPNGSVIHNVPADVSKAEVESIIRSSGYINMLYPESNFEDYPNGFVPDPVPENIDWYTSLGPHEPTLEDKKHQVFKRTTTAVMPVLISWTLFFAFAWAFSGFKSRPDGD